MSGFHLPPALTRSCRNSVIAFFLLTLTASCTDTPPQALDLQWSGVPDRPWPGPDLWANRLQDWEVRNGKLVATSPLPMRTVHFLTRRASPGSGEIRVTLTMGLPDRASSDGEDRDADAEGMEETRDLRAAGGILLGAGGAGLDFRRAALIHHSPGPGGGLFLGVDESGHLIVRDFSRENEILGRSQTALSTTDSLNLTVLVTVNPEAGMDGADHLDSEAGAGGRDDLDSEAGAVSEGGTDGETGERSESFEQTSAGRGLLIVMEARSLGSRSVPVSLEVSGIQSERLAGGIALVSDGGSVDGTETWFSRVRVEGGGIEVHLDGSLGPILGAQHTLSRNVLSLTAQLLPISPLAPGPGLPSADTVRLELRGGDGRWTPAGVAPVVVPGYTATFRLEDWQEANPVNYRLTLSGNPPVSEGGSYQGTIRPEPPADQEFVVAAFTGNHNVASPGVDRGAFDWITNVWFPHDDVVSHVRSHDPDFLFFSGDQVYEGASPTRADFEHPYADYLYKWYLWLWAFRDLTAEIPSVAIPDDHDVFHGNVWGAGGRSTPPGLTGAEAQDQGGYRLPPDWVNMVQRTQAAHLPRPWDPTPSDFGIETYFTDILYGGVSFAVLEDRKFKSPPKLFLPAADVWNGWAQNPGFDPSTEGDPPGTSLLGTSQEEFLEAWATDWADGAWMKVVLSQTIFANVATIPADAMNGSVIPSLPIPEPGAFVTGDKVAADMDSNGWPRSGRDRAVRAMRKGFAVHLAGDQHLASTIQYGVDGFRNGPFALCVPSVANFWPRRWYPPQPSGHRAPDAPAYTGDFLDGFGNPMTVFAVSNPARWGREPATLHQRAPGYGIARFDPVSREVSLAAWPRWANPEAGDPPYPGWPVRFRQTDGIGQEPWGYLPTLEVDGLENPVVEVVSELGGVTEYAIRIKGSRFTPPVFRPGSYAVRVGEPETELMQTFLGLQAAPDSSRALEVQFSPGGQR